MATFAHKLLCSCKRIWLWRSHWMVVMQDFFGVELSVGDIVISSFGSSWSNADVFEYCTVLRFTEKAVVVNQLKIKTKHGKQSRKPANQLIKVDPAQYTMYILKKQKETA
jgi:hypothetical protein